MAKKTNHNRKGLGNSSYIKINKKILYLLTAIIAVFLVYLFVINPVTHETPYYSSPATAVITPSHEDTQVIKNEKLGISFNYLSSMQIIRNDESSIVLGLNHEDFPYITITSDITNLKNLPTCKNDGHDSASNPCATKMEEIFIDGTTTSKYSYQCGNDCGYIIYQLRITKPLEIKAYVSGAGLLKYIDKITSTIKFIN